MSDEQQNKCESVENQVKQAIKSVFSPEAAKPVDDFVSTKHKVTIGGKELSYTATTGRVVLQEEYFENGVYKGTKPKAQIYLTSYVVDSEENRPVTFAFNGGPGSSSIWLHMGVLGPRRVDSGDVGDLVKPPYGIVDNQESILPATDLVIIDPATTGFSRTVEGEKPEPYLGFKGDIESVGEVIRLWVTRNKRWLSPKFIAGESYGTIRGCALADHLQAKYGMYLNGIMLISSCLDFGSLEFPMERAYVNFLPTYAAIAWYHGKHPGRELADVVAEARQYCDRDYPWVLQRGNRLSPTEREEAIAKIAKLTGLNKKYVDNSDLRIEHVHFFTELLREEGLVTGRIDSRFTSPIHSKIAECMDADASDLRTSGAYAAAWNHYVREELNYQSDLSYEIFSEIAWDKWSYKEFENTPVNVMDRLESALRTNQDLKVQVQYGYFDGATPFYAAEDVFAHLKVPAGQEDSIEHKYYESGHMIYLHAPSRVQEANDMMAFIEKYSNLQR